MEYKKLNIGEKVKSILLQLNKRERYIGAEVQRRKFLVGEDQEWITKERDALSEILRKRRDISRQW